MKLIPQMKMLASWSKSVTGDAGAGDFAGDLAEADSLVSMITCKKMRISIPFFSTLIFGQRCIKHSQLNNLLK